MKFNFLGIAPELVQSLLIAYLCWRLADQEGELSLLPPVVIFISIGMLGVSRILDQKRKTEIEFTNLKQTQESEKSAYKLLSSLDLLTRREIATWVHGDLQRSLLKITRSLQAAGQTEAANELALICDNGVRALSHKLYPLQLEVSLVLALTDLCLDRAELTVSDNISLLSFHTSQALVIPFNLRLAVYRITEESLNNAEKKPGTTKISVSVHAVENLIRISILDNGNPLSDAPNHSLGFTLINTYVKQFDGNWTISNTSSGVLLAASLFLPATSTVSEMNPETLLTMRESSN